MTDGTVAGGEGEPVAARRIRHARETMTALGRLYDEPTPANVAALHELHARHLRDVGDEQAAARVDERAEHARRAAAAGQIPPAPTAGPEPAGEATQAQYAKAGSLRADAALRRAVEGSDRTDAYEARAKAARERSAAARRRVRAAEARTTASAQRTPVEGGQDRADDRDRGADERERIADERELDADERDRRADLRDKIADRREKAADARDRTVDKRQRFDRALAAAHETRS